MQIPFLKVMFYILTVLTLTSCGVDCVDKKTGLYKSSRTLKESRAKDLFRFEVDANKSTFQLDSGLVFNIKNAWIENDWRYECIDNQAIIIKDNSYQFVIDADYVGDAINSDYWLGNNKLGAVLRFHYSGQDTFNVTLYKDTSITLAQRKQTIDTIIFIKRQAIQ